MLERRCWDPEPRREREKTDRRSPYGDGRRESRPRTGRESVSTEVELEGGDDVCSLAGEEMW